MILWRWNIIRRFITKISPPSFRFFPFGCHKYWGILLIALVIIILWRRILFCWVETFPWTGINASNRNLILALLPSRKLLHRLKEYTPCIILVSHKRPELYFSLHVFSWRRRLLEMYCASRKEPIVATSKSRGLCAQALTISCSCANPCSSPLHEVLQKWRHKARVTPEAEGRTR
jgi:hypothetical protein